MKFRSAPLALVAGVALLAACSSGSVQGSGSTSTTSTAASKGSSPASASAPSSAPVAVPSLDDKVLQLSDLPTGWAIDNSDDDDDDTEGCASLSSNQKDSLAEKEVDFADNGGLPQAGEDLGYFAEDKIVSEFKTGIAALDKCKSFTMKDDDGKKTVVSLGRMSFPATGDDSAAYTATATISGFNITLNIVAFRKGQYIALIEYGDLGNTDIDQLQDLVKKAEAKLT